jgi:hypothetical protein
MLSPNSQRDKFFDAMAKAHSPRSFVLERAEKVGAFDWRDTARVFLDALHDRLQVPTSGDSA